MKMWQALVQERVDLLELQVDGLRHAGGLAPGWEKPDLDGQHDELTAVIKDSVDPGPARDIGDWWGGESVTAAWLKLHHIEETLDEMTPDDRVDDLVDVAERHLREEEPEHADELKGEIDKATTVNAKRRAAMHAVAASHAAAHVRHANERRQRRAFYAAAAGLVTSAIALVIVQASISDTIVPMPEKATISAWALVALTAVFAAAGAGLSAVASLYLGETAEPTLWYDGRPPRAALKVATGIWTGLIGVIAVGSGMISGKYGSLAAVLLLAAVFGFAQETITAFIDKKAMQLTAASK